jgi:hypothetical protein
MQMTTWTTEDTRLLAAAEEVLRGVGYQFSWVKGIQGIDKFRTRRRGAKDWDTWDAELGAQDLAFMVDMVMRARWKR